MKFDITTNQRRHSALECLAALVVFPQQLIYLPFQTSLLATSLFKLAFVYSKFKTAFWHFWHFLHRNLVNQFALVKLPTAMTNESFHLAN